MTNPDMEGEEAIDSVAFQQCQPGGVAEMFKIQRCRRIVSLHFENARFHLADLPARLQYRQRAFQPGQVEAYRNFIGGSVHSRTKLDRDRGCYQCQIIAA